MSKIMYAPFQLGNTQISNRLVASAMFEYGADNGKITEKIKARYLALADGGAGLIITGMHAISASGSVASIMVNTEYEGYVEDLRSIADAVHERGGKITLPSCSIAEERPIRQKGTTNSAYAKRKYRTTVFITKLPKVNCIK